MFLFRVIMISKNNEIGEISTKKYELVILNTLVILVSNTRLIHSCFNPCNSEQTDMLLYIKIYRQTRINIFMFLFRVIINVQQNTRMFSHGYYVKSLKIARITVRLYISITRARV